MPVRVVSGDLFKSSARVLVNPVNCVGVPGAGLAKAFAARFPRQTQVYVDACHDRLGTVAPGRVFPVYIPGEPTVIHFPTKMHWRDPSRMEWIVAGLRSMHGHLNYTNVGGSKWPSVSHVACPALGCGLGGLEFAKVLRAIQHEFEDSKYDIEVYRPS